MSVKITQNTQTERIKLFKNTQTERIKLFKNKSADAIRGRLIANFMNSRSAILAALINEGVV